MRQNREWMDGWPVWHGLNGASGWIESNNHISYWRVKSSTKSQILFGPFVRHDHAYLTKDLARMEVKQQALRPLWMAFTVHEFIASTNEEPLPLFGPEVTSPVIRIYTHFQRPRAGISCSPRNRFTVALSDVPWRRKVHFHCPLNLFHAHDQCP